MSVRRCARCILSDTFPAINFDADGVCNYCRQSASADVIAAERKAIQADIDGLFERVVATRTPSAMYDVVVAYSGGKDSTYTLKILRTRYNVRCLAVTIDNGFLSASTFENCRKMTEAFGVDHMTFKPSFEFMRQLYQASLSGELHVKAAIKRASAICNSCINLVNAHVINVALQNRVSIIAGGYLGGQLPRGRAYLEIDPLVLSKAKEHELAKYEQHLGAISRRYFALQGEVSPAVKKIYVVNPLVAIDYDENLIIDEIRKIGWQKPSDTGLNSTNCLLNDVGIALHQRRHGFHPYEAELAQLVREARMDRDVALAKVETIPSVRDLQPILDRLNLSKDHFHTSK